MTVASFAIQQNLHKFGKIKSATVQPRTFRDHDFTKIFNPDSREDIQALKAYGSDIVIEVGIESTSALKSLMGTYAGAVVGIRVIDPESGRVRARARVGRVGAGGEKVTLSDKDPNYPKLLKEALERTLTKVVVEAIDKIND